MTDDPHNRQNLSVVGPAPLGPQRADASRSTVADSIQPTRRHWLLLSLASLGAWGCSRWSPNAPQPKSPFELHTPQMAPDTVVLEVALVRLLGVVAPPNFEPTATPNLKTNSPTNSPTASTPETRPSNSARQAFKPPLTEASTAPAPASLDSAPTSEAPAATEGAGGFVDTSATPRFDDEDEADLIPAGTSAQSPAANTSGEPASMARQVTVSVEVNSVDFWQLVDEQALPLETRRRLEQNGLRAGVIHGRPTPALQAALDAHSARQHDLGDAPDSTAPTGIQRIQNRAGKRGKILVSEQRDQLVVLLPEQGRLRGRTYADAQCVISVRSFPQGDGQVELDLLPEIEHGQARQRWLGESTEGSFRIDSSRERVPLNQIRLTPRLDPGQMVVIGPITPLKGLGRQFFGATNNDSPEVRVLVIRVAQTQYDDLFSPERTSNSLITAPG